MDKWQQSIFQATRVSSRTSTTDRNSSILEMMPPSAILFSVCYVFSLYFSNLADETPKICGAMEFDQFFSDLTPFKWELGEFEDEEIASCYEKENPKIAAKGLICCKHMTYESY